MEIPFMKVNILDAHDRYKYFVKQDFDIVNCIKDMIKQKPFGDHPFYIFSHPRTEDDGFNKRYIHQPRLLRPAVATNSMLIRVFPTQPDIVKMIWMIPQRELWDQYAKGFVCDDPFILECIHRYINDPVSFLEPDEYDISPEKARDILFEYQPQLFKRETLPEHLKPIYDQKMAERAKLKTSEASLSVSSLQGCPT